MALNAKPKHLRDTIVQSGTVTATDTDSGTQYDPDNIKDPRNYTKWKAGAAVLNI